MNKLSLEETDNTPKILFDADNGVFEISGVSIPEDSVSFYNPILDWVNEYVKNPNSKINLKCKIDYCNTSSSKQVFNLISSFKQSMENGAEFVVTWEYDASDDDMLFLGKSFSELTNIPFEFYSY